MYASASNTFDFFAKTGNLALGSRLRRLSNQFTEDAKRVYALYNVELSPKWFPVYYVLSETNEMAITEIAQTIGHSHPSVSKIVKEMEKAGLVELNRGVEDGRKNTVKLSLKGRAVALNIQDQYLDVSEVVDELLSSTTNNLLRAIEDMEDLLSEKGFYRRVYERRKERESGQVEIIHYKPIHKEDFRSLNYQWIEQHFKVEQADRDSLDHPEEKILVPGGHIFMARYRGEIVGTCAMIKMSDDCYELAKMAVKESVKGLGIGWLLGKAVLDRARSLGAGKVYLESNTILKPAINLYRKLGFKRVANHETPYERCNIQMEVELK
ncbi:GNAT family N-acetyltransferase [Fulvivirgaceae bacterium BMA10]|uniref:GNAT family N-acetyltransferase n=1 Tax=Splendidivirga corallicola TaxID=3051826 RepID=A0ABT8KMD1_9BACT|nr:GNAT family N-acetyltransferase [Fulvivirgaceae bacterium BMA10]